MSDDSVAVTIPMQAPSKSNGSKRLPPGRRAGRPKSAASSIPRPKPPTAEKSQSTTQEAQNGSNPSDQYAGALAGKTPIQRARATSPLVEALLHTFPQEGADIDEAKRWMDTANAVLKQICKFTGTLSVTAA